MALVRQSSIDRLLNPDGADNSSAYNDKHIVAAAVIISWWKRVYKFNKILTKLGSNEKSVGLVLDTLLSLHSAFQTKNRSAIANSAATATATAAPPPSNSPVPSFEVIQKTLSDKDFVAAITSDILSNLPGDPQLKHKNVLTKSIRVISTAVLMYCYPEEVFVTQAPADEDGSFVDTSLEARTCRNAASMVTLGLIELLKCLSRVGADDTSSGVRARRVRFSNRLLHYRFCARYYLHALHLYQAHSNALMISDVEGAYIQNYAVFYTLSKIDEMAAEDAARNGGGAPAVDGTSSNASMITQARGQCERLRKVLQPLFKTAGVDPAGAQVRLEELEAYIRASVVIKPTSRAGSRSPSPGPMRRGDVTSSQQGGAEASRSRSASAADPLNGTLDPTDDSRKYLPPGFEPSFPAAKPVDQLPTSPSPHLLPLEAKLCAKIVGLVKKDIDIIIWNVTLDNTMTTVLASANKSVTVGGLASLGGPEKVEQSSYQLPESSLMNTFILTNHNLVSAGAKPDPKSPVVAGSQAGTSASSPPVDIRKLPLEYQLRISMLALMKAKLIATFTTSPYSSYKEIRLGSTVHVTFVDAESGARVPLMAVVQAITESAGDDSSGNSLLFTVKYTVDGAMEENIPAERIKLANAGRDPSIFLSACKELCAQITAISPEIAAKYGDIYPKLFDAALIQQMCAHNALSLTDLLPSLVRIFDLIMGCQAAARASAMMPLRQWFTAQWSEAVTAPAPQTQTQTQTTPLAPGEILNKAVETSLPVYFEYMSACLEELRTDMANYYVYLLSSSFLQKGGGYKYLMNAQLAAVHARSASLVLTAQWLRFSLEKDSDFVLGEVKDSGLINVTPGSAAPTLTWKYLLESFAPTTNTNNAHYIYAVAAAYVRLLQAPVRWNNLNEVQQYSAASAAAGQDTLVFPELLQKYRSEIATVRDHVDSLAVKASLHTIIKQLCFKFKIRLTRTSVNVGVAPAAESEELIRLFARLETLLLEHTQTVELGDIKAEVVSFVKKLYVAQYGASGEFAPVEKELAATLSGLFSTTHPVFCLIQKRVFKVLYLSMVLGATSSCTTAANTAGGDSSAAKVGKLLMLYGMNTPIYKAAVTKLLNQNNKIFLHTLLVNGVLYSNIINSISEELLLAQ